MARALRFNSLSQLSIQVDMREDSAWVYVIDDDPALRTALESLLRAAGFQVRLFGSALEFQSTALPGHPCCLLLDIRLPGTSGLELQDQLIRADMHLPVIFMTGQGEVSDSVRALRAGAVTFLTKPFLPHELLGAIREALERDRVGRQERTHIQSVRDRYAMLTARERNILELVVAGRLNKQIAGDLGISEVTVKQHRGRVMNKMGAQSVADLVRMTEKLP